MTEQLRSELPSEVTEQDIEEAYALNAGLDSVKALLHDDTISTETIIVAAKVTMSMPQMSIEGRVQPLGQSDNAKIISQLARIGSR